MREKEIETYLVNRVKAMGGRAYKFVSPGNNGVPDRIVILPDKLFFVELKAPGEEPRPLQIGQINKLRDLGQLVFVCDSKQSVDDLIEMVKLNVI